MAALREAGSTWGEQGCGKWCAEHALAPLPACAAAAMLTVVFVRAEFFTLAIAGLILGLCDDCSCSTSQSHFCSRMAELMGQQWPSPPGSGLTTKRKKQEAGADGGPQWPDAQHWMLPFAAL